jgi:hypothetical protein
MQVLNDWPDNAHDIALSATVMVMVNVLTGIECAECRRLSREMLEKLTPEMIQKAMIAADTRWPAAPKNHKH